MNPGYIYVMEDQLNCNIIKVGYSQDPIARLRQLYTTGTPLPYIITYLWAVEEMRDAENAAHAVLDEHRVNSGREFFYIVPPFSNLPGGNCPDTCSVYLEALAEQIENGYSYMQVVYQSINLNWFKQKHKERLAHFPNGIKGF